MKESMYKLIARPRTQGGASSCTVALSVARVHTQKRPLTAIAAPACTGVRAMPTPTPDRLNPTIDSGTMRPASAPPTRGLVKAPTRAPTPMAPSRAPYMTSLPPRTSLVKFGRIAWIGAEVTANPAAINKRVRNTGV